jgi:polyhydroxyalkanoate synthesis regulator phasin
MVSIQDLQAKANQELDRITAETDVVNAVKVVVDSQNEKLATLKQQVNDLIAAGSVDPAYATL